MTYRIAMVHANSELKFCEDLAKMGFEIYTPRSKIELKRRNKTTITERAAFPKYVFMRGQIRQEQKDRTNGFVGFVHGAISEKEVEIVKAMEASGAYDQVKKAQKFQKGQLVKVVSGAFMGLSGRITRHPSAAIATVEIAGKKTRIPLALLANMP